MYQVTKSLMTLTVVALIVMLIVSALHVTWWFAAILVALAICLGIFAQDVVDFLVNISLGLPAGPRHKSRRNA